MHKILIVDDDLDMLTLVEHLLQKKGYKVTCLSSGKYVLDTMNVLEPDLVILDVNLGLADGRQLCEQIKNIETYQHLPVILYSAEQLNNLSPGNCKANAFIQKPFSPSAFLKQVEALVAA